MSPVSRATTPHDATASTATRVCAGPACTLRGADRIAETLRTGAPVETVPCLGFCDRSPALMDVGSTVHTRVVAGPGAPHLRPIAPGALASRVRAFRTEPIVTRRIGAGDFASLSKAVGDGAYRSLDAAVREPPEELIATVEASGERGHGGDERPTGARLRAVAQERRGAPIAIACGGDPGAFLDRLLLERDPHGVLEGLALCAYAVGADRAVVWLRPDYPRALERVERAIADAEDVGILGERVCGSRYALQVEVRSRPRRYTCTEMEHGNVPQALRPETTADEPHDGPAVVQHVETLVNLPWILEHGAEAYASLGTSRSCGTRALCLSAGFAAPGVVEVPFGVSLREVVEDAGATACDETMLSGILLGGPLGSLLRPSACDVPVCYGAMGERGIRLGHGGMIALDPELRPLRLLRALLEFAALGSCGTCPPCRITVRRALAVLGERGAAGAAEIDQLLARMEHTSRSDFGRRVPGPLRTLLTWIAEAALA